MEDPTETEREAMKDAGDSAGAYIEGLGKTDMATWTGEEWDDFIGVTCQGFVDAMRKRAGVITK